MTMSMMVEPLLLVATNWRCCSWYSGSMLVIYIYIYNTIFYSVKYSQDKERNTGWECRLLVYLETLQYRESVVHYKRQVMHTFITYIKRKWIAKKLWTCWDLYSRNAGIVAAATAAQVEIPAIVAAVTQLLLRLTWISMLQQQSLLCSCREYGHLSSCNSWRKWDCCNRIYSCWPFCPYRSCCTY